MFCVLFACNSVIHGTRTTGQFSEVLGYGGAAGAGVMGGGRGGEKYLEDK